MDYYFSTSYFTLVPESLFSPQIKSSYLQNLFNLETGMAAKSVKLEGTAAFMVYAYPEIFDSWQQSDKNIYPLSLYFYNRLMEMKSHNKVIMSIDRRHKITHIAAAVGNDLKLINTYNTGDFNSALYYLFLALKELQLNPALTHIRLYNTIDSQKMELLNNYFNTIEVYEPDCNIISIR